MKRTAATDKGDTVEAIARRVAKRLAQAAKTVERIHGGGDLLAEVADAYRSLAKGAKSVADGKRAGVDLSPDGEIAGLAKRAAKYAAGNALPLTLPGLYSPCEALGEARESLAKLDEWTAAGLWGERKAQGEEKEALRLALAEVRQAAAGLAERCEKDAHFEDMESAAFIAQEYARAKGAAEVAEVQAELAKVKGNKAGYRQWKRKAKNELEYLRAWEVAQLLKAGWTVEQVADSKGYSVATVERAAKLARERRLLAKRARGRRKGSAVDSGGDNFVTGKAGEISIENTPSGQAWKHGRNALEEGLEEVALPGELAGMLEDAGPELWAELEDWLNARLARR